MGDPKNLMPSQNDYGIDLDQLDFNLSLSPEQRLAHHQAALDLIIELEHARESRETEPQ